MIKKINLKIIYILMILYSVYDILNSASAGNSTDNRSGVYIFLFIIIICLTFFCLNSRIFPTFDIFILLIFFTVYYLFDMVIVKGNAEWGVIVYSGLSVWWILTVWYFYIKVSRDIKIFISIQNFVRIMFMIFAGSIVYGSINIVKNYSVDFARVGYIYHILAMLPFILLERNEKIKNTYLVITVILTIFSFKRGAIIILSCMMFMYFLFNNNIKQRQSNIKKMIFLIVVLILAWTAIDCYSGGYLSSRFTKVELMDGSGRNDIWSIALSNISKRDIFQLFFGIANSSEQALKTGIHNEWIVYLNSNGVIGLFLFLGIVLCIIMQAVKLVKQHSCLAGSYMALVIYILGVCWISGFYYVHSTFYVMLFLGTTQGLLSYRNDEIIKIMERRKR